MVCLTTTTPSTAESHGNASRYVGATSPAQPELLAEVGLFADLTTVELVGLAKLMRPRAYARDEVIYLRGDTGTAFYVIASGRVKIALTSPDVQTRLRTQVLEPIVLGGAETASLLKAGAERWKSVITSANIRLD